jgi:hypothetical protein
VSETSEMKIMNHDRCVQHDGATSNELKMRMGNYFVYQFFDRYRLCTEKKD